MKKGGQKLYQKSFKVAVNAQWQQNLWCVVSQSQLQVVSTDIPKGYHFSILKVIQAWIHILFKTSLTLFFLFL